MLYCRKIVACKILFHHHAQHCRRRAECGDFVFAQKRHDVAGVEAVEIVYEHRALAHPLTVQLAPERLAPARIGYGKVQTVRLAAVPVLGGHEMTERVCMAVLDHFRLARCAGGEEHKRRVAPAGGILRA